MEGKSSQEEPIRIKLEMACGLNSTCGPVCSVLPPCPGSSYSCTDAQIKNQFFIVSQGTTWITAQPMLNTLDNTYQVVPYWIDTAKPLGIPHLPALSFYYDTPTLRILLRIDGYCSNCKINIPKANAGFGPFVLTCSYDSTSKSYGPLRFLPQSKVSCNLVATWAFIKAEGESQYYIRPVILTCRGGYYCLDSTNSIQQDTKTQLAAVAKGSQPLTVSLSSQIPEDNFRLNIYTYNAVQILNFLQPV